MTNDIRTRHLVITLPNVAGEEADILAEDIETALTVGGHGLPTNPDVKVDHLIGEALPADTYVRAHYADFVRVNLTAADPLDGTRQLSLYEARQLAGALLAIPGVVDAEPHHTNSQEA